MHMTSKLDAMLIMTAPFSGSWQAALNGVDFDPPITLDGRYGTMFGTAIDTNDTVSPFDNFSDLLPITVRDDGINVFSGTMDLELPGPPLPIEITFHLLDTDLTTLVQSPRDEVFTLTAASPSLTYTWTAPANTEVTLDSWTCRFPV